MNFKSIRDYDVNGKTVLLRADLNVPTKEGEVTDFTRIDRVKPTINYLRENGAKVLILSHFGRPKGEVNPKYSLEFLAPVLTQRWEVTVGFDEGSTSDVTLLENLRFNAGEEANDLEFAKQLAARGDIFVNDAFSAAHRAHASTEAITHLMPAAAGLLMEAELNALSDALEEPEKPVIAIVGGAKVSTKLSVLNNLVKKVDYLALGGGMANTFIYANGLQVGDSLCEKDMADEARRITQTAKENGCEIILPLDTMATAEFKEGAEAHHVAFDNFPDNLGTMDAGEKSIQNLKGIIDKCKTVLWNGPLGVFEIKPFDNGTNQVAQHVAQLTKANKLVSVAGGGDTVSALENAKAAEDFSYISTAGGAFLEWLEGKDLPGVVALKQAAQKAA